MRLFPLITISNIALGTLSITLLYFLHDVYLNLKLS